MKNNSYNLARAIYRAQSLDGLEGECHYELVREQKDDAVCSISRSSHQSIPTVKVPFRALVAKRDLVANTETSGGFATTSSMCDLGQALRPASVVVQAGAPVINGLRNNATLPVISAGSTAYLPAGEIASGTVSSLTFGQTALTPRRLVAQVNVSKQLLAQASENATLSDIIVQDLVAAISMQLDSLAINGTGNAQPVGIVNTPNVVSYTFGASASFSKFCATERLLANNYSKPPTAWLISPETREKLAQAAKTGHAGLLHSGGFANRRYPSYSDSVPRQLGSRHRSPSDRRILP